MKPDVSVRRQVYSMTTSIERLHELPVDLLGALVVESEQSGYGFVRRLVDEWVTGVNRFDRPGEALFAAWRDGQLVGVCGLNIDPYGGGERVGRVRHLYVLSAFRRLGVGRQLAAAVVAAAQGTFAALRLRTGNQSAARLYEALGFRHSEAAAGSATHVKELGPARATGPGGSHCPAPGRGPQRLGG